MGEAHSIELGFDDAGWAAVEREATRLDIEPAQLVSRATCAWLSETTEIPALVGRRHPGPAA
jgi:hypothetical protein